MTQKSSAVINSFLPQIKEGMRLWTPQGLGDEISLEKTSENLSSDEKFKSDVLEFFNGAINTRLESFESQLNKLETI